MGFIQQYPLTTLAGFIFVVIFIIFILFLIEWKQEDKFWDELLKPDNPTKTKNKPNDTLPNKSP